MVVPNFPSVSVYIWLAIVYIIWKCGGSFLLISAREDILEYLSLYWTVRSWADAGMWQERLVS